MIINEWSLRQVTRSPVAVILLFVLLSVIAVLCRAVVELRADVKQGQTQLIVCKEEAARTVEQMKNDQIEMLYQFQSRQDTMERRILQTRDKLENIKRKMK